MKRKQSITFAIIVSIITITLCTLLPSQLYARRVNCSTSVGSTIIYCYGATNSICFTEYNGGEPRECRGTEIVIFKPDDPE